MTVRTTSIDAYHEIESMGLLRGLQWKVYSHLFWHGPLTSGEAYYQQFRRNGIKQRVPSQIRARFTELRDMGVLREVGERPCKVTGHRCIVWDVTDGLPGKLIRRKGWRAMALRLRAELAEQTKRAKRYKRWCTSLVTTINRPERWYKEHHLPVTMARMNTKNVNRRPEITKAQRGVLKKLLRRWGESPSWLGSERGWIRKERVLAVSPAKTLMALVSKGLVELKGGKREPKVRLTEAGRREAAALRKAAAVRAQRTSR